MHSDVLKRHRRSCPARPPESGASPSDSEGQEPLNRACDRCYRLKKACDKQVPCGLCQSKQASCTYSRNDPRKAEGASATRPTDTSVSASALWPHDVGIEHAFQVVSANAATAEYPVHISHSLGPALAAPPLVHTDSQAWEPDQPFMNAIEPATQTLASGSQPPQVSEAPKPEESPFIQFLVNVARATSLSHIYDCLTEEQGWQVLRDAMAGDWAADARPMAPPLTSRNSHVHSFEPLVDHVRRETSTYHSSGSSSMVLPSDAVSSRRSIRALSTGSQNFPPVFTGSAHPSPDDVSQADSAYARSSLQAACSRIVTRLREVSLKKGRNSIVDYDWTPEIEQTCNDFFSPGNSRRFVSLYFASWYPNCPIVHKPTFDPTQAVEALLAIMFLFGKQQCRGNSYGLMDKRCMSITGSFASSSCPKMGKLQTSILALRSHYYSRSSWSP
jgi:hypothetical protein